MDEQADSVSSFSCMVRIGPAGEVVTPGDTAPSEDHWNMAAVEIHGDRDDS